MCNCNGKCGDNCKCKKHKKTYYPLTFVCEDSETILVEMTDEEAVIVKRVLDEANKSISSNYCGKVSLDLDGKVESEV